VERRAKLAYSVERGIRKEEDRIQKSE